MSHPVAAIPRTARFDVHEPPFDRPRRKGHGLIKGLLALAALLLVFGFDYPILVPSGAEFNRGENGVWLGARWSNTLVPSNERRDMANRLAAHGVKWIYADEGAMRIDGSVPGANSLYAGGLASDIHHEQPGMRVLAWINGSNKVAGVGGDLSLADPSVRQRIARACKFFIEQQNFDGVHLDIEPAPGGDPNYLKLLDEIRSAIGNKTLSVAAMKWTPLAPRVDSFSFLPYNWDRSYYQEVARRADQVVLMSDDSAIPFANLYIKYVSWQTGEVVDALRDFPSCQVLIGLPTFSDERWDFHLSAENMGTGLQGVIEALDGLRRNGNLPPNFSGVALFADRTTSPDEWNLFDKVWRGH